jgi:hypothetical protein
VLLKLVQLLGMILNLTFSQDWKCRKGTAMLIRDCRNLSLPSRNILDSEVTPRDVGLFTRDHVQTMEDSEGIAAINGETVLYYLGGFDEVTLRIMDGSKPALDVAWSSYGMKDSDITARQRKIVPTGDGWMREALPEVGEVDGMDGRKKLFG